MVTPGYDRVAVAASHIGPWILAIAVTVLVTDLIVMVIYTIRQGQSDDQKGKVITEKRPLTSMSLGIPPLMGRSKRKILGSKSDFITDDSLADGTATFGQRMMVLCIITACTSFFLIFVAAGLMLMKDNQLAILFLIIPDIWLYNVVSEAWHGHQKAKKRVAARFPGWHGA